MTGPQRSDTQWAAAVQRLRTRVLAKMEDVRLGQPLHLAAAELGMIPSDFQACYNVARGGECATS